MLISKVWAKRLGLVYIRKERFSEQRISKLMPWEYGHFQIIERIDDNTYIVDLLGEYDVSSTFNVFLSLFISCKWWFRDESFQGEMEWCDPSNTKRSVRGSNWSGNKIDTNLPQGTMK